MMIFILQAIRYRVMWWFPFFAMFVIGYIPELDATVSVKLCLVLLAFGSWHFCKK
jgi:hypothetical protein